MTARQEKDDAILAEIEDVLSEYEASKGRTAEPDEDEA